jgi:hypothetical protein
MEFIGKIGVSGSEETTGDGSYVEHEATYFSFEGVRRDHAIECTTGEGESEQAMGRPEGSLGEKSEGDVMDDFVGQCEERHADGWNEGELVFEGFASFVRCAANKSPDPPYSL